MIAALDGILTSTGMNIESLARSKYRLVEALIKVIAIHRDVREASAFQRALIPQSGLEFETTSDVELVFDEANYSYQTPYRGGTGFKKHLFRIVGDLEPSGEEYECAVYIERSPLVKGWVRNTLRQPHSFSFQTSSDKFYPDFVALLADGRYLVVEYKGSHLISAADAREKQLIGDLWADRSKGNCIFLMIEDKQFGRIDRAVANATG